MLSIDLGRNKVSLYCPRQGSVGAALTYKVAKSASFMFKPDTTYKVVAFHSRSQTQVELYEKNNPTHKVSMSVSHSSAFYTKSPERMAVGSLHGLNIKVYWDNLYMCSSNKSAKQFKTDYSVAKQLVAQAFQGMIPFKSKSNYDGDYFAGVTIGPEVDFYQLVDFLSYQNACYWHFDYDGTFVFDKKMDFNPVYTLDDSEIEHLSLSFNPTQFKNWIEVTDEEKEPKVRINPMAHQKSILHDGIRYAQVKIDRMTTSEQGKKVALKEFYKNAEAMETLTLSLSRPIVFLKPKDVIRLDSDALGVTKYRDWYDTRKDEDGNVQEVEKDYFKMFTVTSVSIKISGKDVSVDLDLSSRLKAFMDSQELQYDKGGIVEG
jgi:hypothetical protein